MKPHALSRRKFVRTTFAAGVAAPFLARGASSEGFEIGLVADAQYADIDAKGTRFYRDSIGKLGAAVEHFEGRQLAFCVHLGDLVDRQWHSFDAITKPLAASRHRWHHLLGNHDFDVLDREKPEVPRRLGMKGRYTFLDRGAFRFVFLDTNDVSTYAHAAGSAERVAAEAELNRLQAAKVPQARPWNGGVGPAQLRWLDRTCAEARDAGAKVILLGHHPVHPAGGHNVWNSDEVLALIDRHRNVVAWLNGHNHAGKFGERDGVPFLTMHGMVETQTTNAFATARVLPDRIVVEGHGREPSREMRFRT